MPVIDPSGFNIWVRLRTPEATFPLWMGGGSADGQSFFRSGEGTSLQSFQDIPIVQGVQIELDPGLNGKVSIEIGAPYDMGLALLESELFTIGNVLEVQIGYPRIGLFLPWFHTMEVRPQITLNPDDGLTATLEGQGGTFAANRGTTPNQFTNGSYTDIIKHIAGLEHNNWDVQFPTASTGGEDPLTVVRDSVSQGNRSDWMFLNYLARQAGCEVLALPSSETPGRTVVQINRRADGLLGTPQTTLVARGQIDMLNRFPILSFESGMEGVWLPRQRIRTADVDPDSRETPEVTVSQEAREGDGRVPRLREGSVGEGAGQVGDTTIAALPAEGDGQFLTAPARDPSRTPTEAASMEADEAAFRGGINATVTTIGLPTIFPGQTVRIEGMGVFNGNYMIMGLTHAASESEWTTTLNLMTNASFDGERINTLIVQQWQDFNDDQPEEQTDAEGGGTEEASPLADVSDEEWEELVGGPVREAAARAPR